MAKFVVAGRSDCPYFARVELLGDRLAKNVEKFELHKIFIQPKDWEEWLDHTCKEKGWKFSKSPIVWRELIDRGGKGILIGGANDFQEYVRAYYDLESEMNSYDMRTIANENKVTKNELDEEEEIYQAMSSPLYVCITNAANAVAYHLIMTLTSGKVLGPHEEVTVRLLVSSPEEVEFVTGMAMEVEDLAQGLMRGVTVCTEPEEAFDRCSIIIMLDELVQEFDESLTDCLIRNESCISRYAKIINEKALKTCKILLSGQGPINFNTMMMIEHCPNLLRQNIVAVSTVIENTAKSVIGEQLTVNPGGIVNLLLWGNINGSHYFDVSKCRVHNYDGAIWGPYWFSVDAQEMIHDKKWVTKEFPALVEGRTKKISDARGHSTSLSSGNAVCTILQYWFQGSPSGQILSLGVYSEGWYGIPEGLVFSLPITMDPKGYWHVVQDVEITPELKQALGDAVHDLKREIGLFKGEIEEHQEFLGENKADEEAVPTEGAGSPEKTKSPSPAPAQLQDDPSQAQGEATTPGTTDNSPAVPAVAEEENKTEGESAPADANAITPAPETNEENKSAEETSTETPAKEE